MLKLYTLCEKGRKQIYNLHYLELYFLLLHESDFHHTAFHICILHNVYTYMLIWFLICDVSVGQSFILLELCDWPQKLKNSHKRPTTNV